MPNSSHLTPESFRSQHYCRASISSISKALFEQVFSYQNWFSGN
jgi:hypothetical protein